MIFTDQAWDGAADVLKAIEGHPFVTGLADGTLSAERYRYYMAQDALYLADYGRMLALAASQATHADEVQFWSESAERTIVVERELHAQFVADLTAASKSPTCTAYTSYLAAVGALGSYSTLVAGLVPCFWIYEYVGNALLVRAGDLNGHPYGPWIGTYADPAFAAASQQARDILDRAVAEAGAGGAAQAGEAFLTACRYEWMFWDAAWRMENWPI